LKPVALLPKSLRRLRTQADDLVRLGRESGYLTPMEAEIVWLAKRARAHRGLLQDAVAILEIEDQRRLLTLLMNKETIRSA
jgi:hypothetical protein